MLLLEDLSSSCFAKKRSVLFSQFLFAMAAAAPHALVEVKETGEKASQKMISNETKLATNNTSRNAEIFMTSERERESL